VNFLPTPSAKLTGEGLYKPDKMRNKMIVRDKAMRCRNDPTDEVVKKSINNSFNHSESRKASLSIPKNEMIRGVSSEHELSMGNRRDSHSLINDPNQTLWKICKCVRCRESFNKI